MSLKYAAVLFTGDVTAVFQLKLTEKTRFSLKCADSRLSVVISYCIKAEFCLNPLKKKIAMTLPCITNRVKNYYISNETFGRTFSFWLTCHFTSVDYDYLNIIVFLKKLSFPKVLLFRFLSTWYCENPLWTRLRDLSNTKFGLSLDVT